jgi:hypothetical protein
MVFHTHIVLSCEPETMLWPSGENATEKTAFVCPINGPAIISPVMGLHTQIVASHEPEAIHWPSGENVTEEI